MIVLGTAGTRKSFLIGRLKKLLKGKVMVMAPTGVAAFNVSSCTCTQHYVFPQKERSKISKGMQLQESLADVEYNYNN